MRERSAVSVSIHDHGRGEILEEVRWWKAVLTQLNIHIINSAFLSDIPHLLKGLPPPEGKTSNQSASMIADSVCVTESALVDFVFEYSPFQVFVRTKKYVHTSLFHGRSNAPPGEFYHPVDFGRVLLFFCSTNIEH